MTAYDCVELRAALISGLGSNFKRRVVLGITVRDPCHARAPLLHPNDPLVRSIVQPLPF